ncbi:putative ABC Multidrug Transporter (ATP Binding Cassette) [Candidatus Kuenenia stuttgartiensis]|uniref:Putative ABC Multidrug Transporter (ATP Binding Cassette) n=1 Tax=Kuenenia stuttgartiensis TaxID=174633 RepID=A0A6G7GX29_KUEST|nr:ABC transporter ATP-binding protein [Candidatus Kuenenia stuttgartiensis]QII13863.1 putative ABC Multidrug Transporter (ATP Binding Cassette) [Candidatus Kuenenia stuttgartiensis]
MLIRFMKKLKTLWQRSIVYRVFVKKYRRYFIIGAISLITVDIINIFPPLIIKKTIDMLSGDGNMRSMVYYIGLFLLATFFQGVCRYVWRIYFIGTSFRCEHDLRMAFFKHIETQSQRFFQKYKTGDLMSRATNDMNAIRMAVGPGLLIGLDALLYFIVIPPIIIWLSPKLSLFTCILMPLTPFIAYKIRNVIDRQFCSVQEQFSRISEKVRESISGIRVVKSFNISQQEEAVLRELSRDFVKKNLKLAIPQSLLGPAFEYITYLGIIMLLCIGGRMVIQGDITLGTLVAFQSYISMMIWPMTAVGWCVSLLQRGNASMKRIDEVMEEKPEIDKHSVTSKKVTLKGDIEFRDVHFQYYKQDKWILKGIHLKIRAGQRVAIVGSIGSGKTTLLSLLPRILSVKDGTVFIDGMDINAMDVTLLRRCIGFVPQEAFLFSERIADAILFGNAGAGTDENVRELARMVKLEAEIQKLPDQYESYLGERGVNLSGGQKQRLTIARALAVNPDIIIMDDCLSAVDVQGEHFILHNIATKFPGKTLIIVTHRLPAIRDFDVIVVMKEGMIVEKGTHAELMKMNGEYSALYRKEELEEGIEIL